MAIVRLIGKCYSVKKIFVSLAIICMIILLCFVLSFRLADPLTSINIFPGQDANRRIVTVELVEENQPIAAACTFSSNDYYPPSEMKKDFVLYVSEYLYDEAKSKYETSSGEQVPCEKDRNESP